MSGNAHYLLNEGQPVSTANPLPTREAGPISAANGSVQTSAVGATFVALAAAVAREVEITNQTGTVIEVRRGGAGVAFQLPSGSIKTFAGVSNASDLSLRRTDTSNVQVTLQYEVRA